MGVNYERALILYRQSKWELAEKELRQELANDPDSAMAHTLLALCLTKREAFEPATEAAQKGVALMPDSPFAYHGLAKVLYDRNRFDEALVAITEAIRLAPDNADSYGMLSMIRFEQREWQLALDAANIGLQMDPEDVACKNLRAMALVKLGRRIEAGATIEHALARDPESALTHANQGWVQLEARNYEKAMEHFREALRLDPQSDWARRGVIETLKARNFIYGLMLRWFLFMGRLSRKMQWGIVIVSYFGSKFLFQAARNNPSYAPYLYTLFGIYLFFVFMCWLADPLFNLVLRTNKTGRLALDNDQIKASNWVGAGLLFALAWVAACLVAPSEMCIFGAITFGCLMIPLAGTFKVPPGGRRVVMALYTLALYSLASYMAWILNELDHTTTRAVQNALASRFTTLMPYLSYGFLLSQFAANWLASMTVRR